MEVVHHSLTTFSKSQVLKVFALSMLNISELMLSMMHIFELDVNYVIFFKKDVTYT